MLPDEAHNLLVGLRHAQAGRCRGRGRGQVTVVRGPVAVDMLRRRAAVGARLVHGCGLGGRRQPAGPLARRPMPCALVPRVTGGQAGPLAAACAPRSSERRDHERARRIGLDAATATE